MIIHRAFSVATSPRCLFCLPHLLSFLSWLHARLRGEAFGPFMVAFLVARLLPTMITRLKSYRDFGFRRLLPSVPLVFC